MTAIPLDLHAPAELRTLRAFRRTLAHFESIGDAPAAADMRAGIAAYERQLRDYLAVLEEQLEGAEAAGNVDGVEVLREMIAPLRAWANGEAQ